MRPVHLIPLFLMLCSLSFGVNTSQLKLYISGYLSEGETYKITQFDISEGEYYIINISNAPSLILHASWNGSLSTLASKDDIRNALLGYYASQGISNDTKLNESDVTELLYLLDSYNKTRGGEFDCKALIGIDRFPCVDHDTCWRACYTPICRQMEINGGEEFIRDIWGFSNSSSYVDSNLSALVDAVAARPDLDTQNKVGGLITFVDNIERSSIMTEENDIFNASSLGFCSPLDYNLTYIDQARAILNKKYMVFQLRVVDGTASEILVRTNQRILLRSQIIESNSNQSVNASQNNPLIGKGLLDASNTLLSGILILIVILAMAVVFVANSIMRKRSHYK